MDQTRAALHRTVFRWDLGIRGLIPDWRLMLSREGLEADIVAGLTVACVAIPLSLAIALASGVAPAIGLVTAIVAGIVCALFGGTRLAVSGPAAAMAILVASVVQEHGLAGLLVVGLACGALQLVTGVFGLGRFIRLVPRPVIEGFTAGIGAIILIGQLPRALGLPPAPAAHVFDTITHIADLLHRTHPAAVAIALGSVAIIYGLPRLTRRVPPHLMAVLLASVATTWFGLDVATIGEIPRSLPSPTIPPLPPGVSLSALAASALAVYALASLETLLSSSAVDKMTSSARSDPDQELIGQGLGNVACALFGGIPVTGVIVRSATNVHAGAKTRRSAIIHALTILLSVLAFAPVIARIPVASLAGVLFTVAFRMLDPRAFRRLWKHSRGDGAVFAITLVVIVLVDLLEGIQWGIVASLVIAAIQLGRTRLVIRPTRRGHHYAFTLEGPLTFMSSLDIENLRRELDVLEPGQSVIIDAVDVAWMDASGSEMFVRLIEHARSRGLRPVVVGLGDDRQVKLEMAAGDADLTGVFAKTERDAATLMGDNGSADLRLLAGIDRYRTSLKPRYRELFEQLASGQAPHTLFITCSDSRVQPNLLTATDPGELFIVRDIGNIVAPEGAVRGSSTAAAIEYAVGVLHVQKIVVCGHSSCGAIAALLAREDTLQAFPNLQAWLDAAMVRDALRSLPKALHPDEVARLNVLEQVERVQNFRIVQEAMDRGVLSVAAWFFDIAHGELEEWSPGDQRFVPVGEAREVDKSSGVVATAPPVHAEPIRRSR